MINYKNSGWTFCKFAKSKNKFRRRRRGRRRALQNTIEFLNTTSSGSKLGVRRCIPHQSWKWLSVLWGQKIIVKICSRYEREQIFHIASRHNFKTTPSPLWRSDRSCTNNSVGKNNPTFRRCEAVLEPVESIIRSTIILGYIELSLKQTTLFEHKTIK